MKYVLAGSTPGKTEADPYHQCSATPWQSDVLYKTIHEEWSCSNGKLYILNLCIYLNYVCNLKMKFFFSLVIPSLFYV